MTAGRRRRFAVGAAIALGVALVLLRRSQVQAPAPAEPVPASPPAPPPQPREWPVPPVAPPPPPPGAAPLRWRKTRIALGAAIVLAAAALLTASLWPKSNSLADSFQQTFPTVTTPTTSVTTAPTSTTPGSKTLAGSPFCVDEPSGWRNDWVPGVVSTPPALVLTNFKFGGGSYDWGLLDPRLHWRSGGVMIAVADWTKTASSTLRHDFVQGNLQIRSSDVGHVGGFKTPIGHRLIRTDGRLLEIFVEARPLTPAALASANRVLAGVQICSAGT